MAEEVETSRAALRQLEGNFGVLAKVLPFQVEPLGDGVV
jgi:hypothetical protein